jgi:hypothetical protein
MEYKWRLDNGQKYSVVPSADRAMPSEATFSFCTRPSASRLIIASPSTMGIKSGSAEVERSPLSRRSALPQARSRTMMPPGPCSEESVT